MIKIGITGGETKTAGELLRLALHHPDVEISTVHSPANSGKAITTVHHGFIGEEKILFTSNFDATGLDIAFLIKPVYSSVDWAKLMADRPGLRIVLFPESASLDEAMSTSGVYGLSEMNRKPLVRSARIARIPLPLVSPILVAAYPLAYHLMLPGKLSLEIEAPRDLIEEAGEEQLKEEISGNLKSVQASYSGNLELDLKAGDSDRSMRIAFEIPSETDPEEILKIYNTIYDDHNFTFMTFHKVAAEEVEGTNRIIISILQPQEGKIRIEAIADARMRGGAGEAIHIMNLLFHLHEKTGLELKASKW